MTKELWLKLFEKTLKKLPRAERKKVVEFYREMIEDKLEGGESYEKVIETLGNPYDSAKKILDENGINYNDSDVIASEHTDGETPKAKKKKIPTWLAFILGFIGVPVCIAVFSVGIGLAVSWFAVLVTFWAVFGSMVISAGACFIASFVSIFLGISGYVGSGWALFGGCVAGTGVLMLLAVVFWYLANGMSKATAWACKKIAQRGGKNEDK